MAQAPNIRAHAKYRKVPILCVLGSWGRMLSEVAIEGLDHAVKAMMANGIVDYLILIDGDLQHIARATDNGSKAAPQLERRASRG